jgi:hypothetical protein
MVRYWHRAFVIIDCSKMIRFTTLLEWSSTFAIVYATMVLNFSENIELAKIIYLFGAIGWAIVGYLWNRYSIVLINVVLICVWIAGKVM